MGAQKARAMKSGTGSFDVDEFITKLRNFMNGGLKPENIAPEDDEDGSEYNTETSKLDWDRIGRLALSKSRRAPALTFMSVETHQRVQINDKPMLQAGAAFN